MTGADMDSVVCGGCGAVNEVEAGARPACDVCGVSLRLGTLAPPIEETEAETSAPSPGGDPEEASAAEPESAGDPGLSASSGAHERCRCDELGGASPGDPTICFRCGGRLPAPPVLDGDEPGAQQPAMSASQRRTTGASGTAGAPCCTLVLADGHRVRVGSGVLISGASSRGAHPGVLFIDSRTVSRKHAWLREDGGKVEIVDLGSTNGTWVEGSRIEALRAVDVGPGASVRISFGRSVRVALEFGSIGEDRESEWREDRQDRNQ